MSSAVPAGATSSARSRRTPTPRRGRPRHARSTGAPVKRNFVHVGDLANAILAALDHPSARQQLFNIAMDEPVDYAEAAEYLRATRRLPGVEVPTPYRSTWLDNAKAKFLLGWRPQVDLHALIDQAWDYQRAPDDPRKIWYPG
ncbi:MAG: hypothetical protein R3F11_15275 [Verrucomicrobiales bacterium]